MKFIVNCVFLFLYSYCYGAVDTKESVLLSDVVSPVTTNAVYIFGAGALITSFIFLDKHRLDEQAEFEHRSESPLGENGRIGNIVGWGYLNAFYVIGFGLHGHNTKNKLSQERSEIMLASTTYTLLTTSILKLSINRARPRVDNKNDAFPSGHTAVAFNFASVVAAEHGVYWGGAAYGLASAIGYTRVHDGWHWLTDVLAGATIGMSYGWGVHFNRRKKNRKFWFSILPRPSQKAVYASGGFQF